MLRGRLQSKRPGDRPEKQSARSDSGPLLTGVRLRLVPVPTPPLCALYSGATPKLRAGGDDCLTAANEGGNVLGKRLTAGKLLQAGAVCRARRHCDQRQHHASSRQTNHHGLHPPAPTGCGSISPIQQSLSMVDLIDGRLHALISRQYPFVKLPSLRTAAQICKRAFGHFMAISTPPTAADNSTPTLTPRN
jgi:hypothetical protein